MSSLRFHFNPLLDGMLLKSPPTGAIPDEFYFCSLGVGATATASQKMVARGPMSGLLPSKRRPTEDEATSSKRPSDSRGGQDEDSDDEEDRGRSSIGDKSKKRKTGHTIVAKPHTPKSIPAQGGVKLKKKKKKAAQAADS